MADKKISALDAVTAIAGTDILPLSQGTNTRKATAAKLKEFFTAGLYAVGDYADRPAANVSKGVMYYAQDVMESYLCDGSTWTVLPAGGSELGYAQLGTLFGTGSTTPVDIPGMTVTCKVGERPVVVTFGGHIACDAQFARLYLVVDGVTVGNILSPNNYAKSTGTDPAFAAYNTRWREVRLPAFATPGQEHTFKLQLMTIGEGSSLLYGASAEKDYSSLQVRTA